MDVGLVYAVPVFNLYAVIYSSLVLSARQGVLVTETHQWCQGEQRTLDVYCFCSLLRLFKGWLFRLPLRFARSGRFF